VDIRPYTYGVVVKRSKDYWWLLALEAAVFFSLPSWEMTSVYAAPANHPIRFFVSLVIAATAAMFACHVGPGLFAIQFKGRLPRLAWILLPWLGLGYLEWLGSLARSAAGVCGIMPSWITERGPWITIVITLTMLLAITAAVWINSLWRGILVVCMLLGSGILIWALATDRRGLGVRNSHMVSELDQLDWLFAKGVLLSAAPCVVIGWRVGSIEPARARVWMSGLGAVWLPAVLSITIASLATQGGFNLYWKPSLFRDFTWALLGHHGRLEPGVMALAVSTLSAPALLSAFCLKEIIPGQRWWSKWWLSAPLICVLSYAAYFVRFRPDPDRIFYTFGTPFHEFWAWSLVMLGAAAGFASMFSPRSRRSHGSQ
jgi:hypothetical protein